VAALSAILETRAAAGHVGIDRNDLVLDAFVRRARDAETALGTLRLRNFKERT
jgi:50S ribosomal subunit-associated GTPase HflX